MKTLAHRNTIFEEQAEILFHQALPEKQFLLRLHAPNCAKHATAGSFVHIQCDNESEFRLRRPISIMRVDKQAGWLEILYKIVGHGTSRLAQQSVGNTLSCLGPIGQGFRLNADKPRRLLIGGGVGIPPMIFLAQTLKQLAETQTHKQENLTNILAILGSEIPFPFKTQPSHLIVPSLPSQAIACMALLDDWQIASRLCSLNDYHGCYQGYVTDLARIWLNSLDQATLSEIEIFSCGPLAMLKSVSKLAADFNLACQVSLEEYMACAVGGCAGCVVEIKQTSGTSMKRVCVDGPVFDAKQVAELHN